MLLKKVRSAIGGGQNTDKHNALIDEFKLAHKKMFKNGFADTTTAGKHSNEVSEDFLLHFL